MTPWTVAYQASLSFTISQSLPKFMPTAWVMRSSHLILWCPLLLLPSIFPNIRDFSNESAAHYQITKILEFQLQHLSFQCVFRVDFPKIDWLDPLNVQGALSSVQFSHSVVSNSLQPRGLKHARLPCPSPIPGAYSNSCPLSQWFYPTISSCHLLLFPPSIFPSIRVFSNESALHIRWPK